MIDVGVSVSILTYASWSLFLIESLSFVYR